MDWNSDESSKRSHNDCPKRGLLRPPSLQTDRTKKEPVSPQPATLDSETSTPKSTISPKFSPEVRRTPLDRCTTTHIRANVFCTYVRTFCACNSYIRLAIPVHLSKAVLKTLGNYGVLATKAPTSMIACVFECGTYSVDRVET